MHDPRHLREHLETLRRSQQRIGLVPTMGALHEGHLSLVRASLNRCDTTIVSIFVNPSQFGPNEDFQKYPRTLDADIALLETLGDIIVFAPAADAVYPAGYDSWVEVGGVTSILEGAVRPGHFRGVATIVLKLFLMTGADEAFFGQKDYQQVTVIRNMATDLNVPTGITLCPIIREPDGLAMSSRNRYLTPDERRRATVLFRSLQIAEQMIVEQKVRDVEEICRAMRQAIESEGDIVIDYVVVADPHLRELRELDSQQGAEIVILLAARVGMTRLIDNMICRVP